MRMSGGKLMPHLDEKSTKQLNLTVLQRTDPSVEDILFTAAHVAFYHFHIHSTLWSRKDVEGSLFVVKRNTQPRFQFIVMNRRNTDNLVENLLEDFEYEVQTPYLLYRNAAQEVNGIWFYNARECEEVGNLFSRILNAYSKVPTKSKLSPTKSEFEEQDAIPTLTAMDGPLEPSSSASSVVVDLPDDRLFVNFFSNAMNIGSSPNVPAPRQPYHSVTANSTHPRTVTLPTLTSAQTPSTLPTSISIKSIFENAESNKGSTDLVKPSPLFVRPPSSSPVVMPPLFSSGPTAPPLNIQRSYGAPLLQPFPPPTPPPSLTPASPNYGPVISREKVRAALQMLVQDNQFIDMVYQAVLNAHEA